MPGNETTRLGGPGGSKGHRGGRGPVTPSSISLPHATSLETFVGLRFERDRQLLRDLSEIALCLVPARRWRAVARRWARALDLEIFGGRS